MEATALRKKLFFSLFVQALMTLYLFPDDKGTNRPGWVGFLLMLLAILCGQLAYTVPKFGSTVPTIFCIVFTTQTKSFQFSAVQLAYHTHHSTVAEDTLCGVSVKVYKELRGKFGQFEFS